MSTFIPEIEVSPMDEHNQQLLANTHPDNWQNPIPTGRYNLVVIGAGSAGMVAAIGAAGLGAKVALIERSLLGGDCLNVGCLPSKTVIRSAKVVGDINLAARLGVEISGDVNVDFGAVMERMRRIRAHVSHHDSVHRLAQAGVDLYLGAARFAGPDTIQVGEATLNFKRALIATGGRPMELPIPGLAEAGYLTNLNVFNLTERPRRLAVIGAGPIGSELSQTFQRLGSEVTVFDILSQVLGREDADAAKVVERAMRADGLDLRLEAKLNQVTSDGTEKTIQFEHQGESHSLTVDEILVAAGRVPNIEGLNLEAAGVTYHKKGVEVNDYLQTSNPNIYAAGDVALKYQFTHTADASARIVLENALFMGRKKLSDLIVPWCTYTDPEVAHVGMYPDDAEAAGLAVETYTTYMAEVDRALADEEDEGFVKIHVEKGSDRILGATIVARHAGEMISEITLAMVAGAGMKTLAQVIHPYPTQAEAIKKAADAYNRTRLTPTLHKISSGWLELVADERVDRPETKVAAGAMLAAGLAGVAYFGSRFFKSNGR